MKYEQSNKFNLFSLLQGERKKLKKNDYNEHSMISKFIPSFFKISDRKSITDIKIDEHRNILYSISMSLEDQNSNQTIIEVFDLGILANKFVKISTIS